LIQVSEELENMQGIMSSIKKAISYPIILILFSIAAVIVLLVYVMPTIISMFDSVEQLPGITKAMLSLSDFLEDYWFLVVFG